MPVTPPCTRDHLRSLIDDGTATVGEHTYGEPTVLTWRPSPKLRIGKYCSIGREVMIFLGGNHRIDWVTTYPFSDIDAWPEAHAIQGHPSSKGDVSIGSDVWLGFGCCILSGLTIGDGAVVGARAVVTKSVPPYAIVAGNPARIVRYRFPRPDVRALLHVRWWDWPDDRVRAELPKLMSGDVRSFLARAGVEPPSAVGRIKALIGR